MKEIKGLERRIHLCECFHLALITPCVSLVMAMFIKEESQLVWVLMAFGTIIPVQLIRYICDRVQKKSLKALLAVGVAAAATGLTVWHYYWMCYAACCIPMLISGLILPRQKDRLIFTTPTLIALIPIVLLYALGKIYPKPLLCSISIILAALVTLNYFLYMNQTRLLEDIGTAVFGLKAEVSVTGLIRQNRKIVAGFLLAAALVLVVVPILVQSPDEGGHLMINDSEVTATPAPTEEPEPPEEKSYRESPKGDPVNVELFTTVLPFTLAFLVMLGCIVGAIALIWMLINSITKQKDGPMQVEDGMLIERLKPETASKEKEHIVGFEKKIRRGYEKLIKSRAPEKSKLAAKTPSELEQTAGIDGNPAETIHGIYSRTRYSAEPATKESYAAFQNAVRTLPPPASKNKQNAEQDPADR